MKMNNIDLKRLKGGHTTMLMEAILNVFGEPVIDTLKILPLLFLAYLLMELLEKKASKKMENSLGKLGKLLR